MPWEKSFDIDKAIDDATAVFWAKGYEATSLADLLKATNINRGSFYNAFGSKKKLFMQALWKYDQQTRQNIIDQLATMQDPLAAIDAFFTVLIEQSKSDELRKGCLLINTALDLPNQDQDVKDTVTQGMAQLQDFFKQQIILGQQQNVISEDKDAALISTSLVTLVVGLRVLARGVYDIKDLEHIKKQALDLIK